jgi:CysZ protein
MKDVFAIWPQALRYLFKDPINFILFLIPTFLAVMLYAILGYYFMASSLEWAQAFIFEYVISQNTSRFLYYLVSGLLMFLFYILVSWTFILVIGVLASPFNDVISGRIEKKILGNPLHTDRSKTLKDVLAGLVKTLWNEFKKIIVILFITLIASLLNFIPIFYPVALILLCLLMSASYLDYSWSRHDLSVSQCLKDLMGQLLTNIFAGAIFLVLIAVPFINALVPALATSYYTVLWTKRLQKKLSA